MKKTTVFKNIHSLIPFSKLLKLLFGIAAGLQLIIITYNHLSGFYILDDATDFITRFIFGTLLSLVAGFLIAYPDLSVIKSLNKSFPWDSRAISRVVIQLSLTIIIAVAASTLVTILSHTIGAYREGLFLNLLYNGLIFSVCNVLMMMILEAWIFFMEGTASKQKTEHLQRELSQIRFEVLKNQINPHFMFNSLNVLSGLIEKDPGKAQQFIDEFSNIYRYVLETIEMPIVSLEEELGFARSYMFLQQIRYGENIRFSFNLPTDLLTSYLPPLSLQVVLENACKHNLVSAEKPLSIDIKHQGNRLIITNNIQLKISTRDSAKVGQKNLLKRYQLISSEEPEFRVGTTHYQVTLPLIKEDQNEYSDY